MTEDVDANREREATFSVPAIRVYARNESDVMFSAPYSGEAWLACQDAPRLREWK